MAVFLNRPLSLVLKDFEVMTGHDGSKEIGYMDQDAIYYALRFNIPLVLCMEQIECQGKDYKFTEFNNVYDKYDGILVGIRESGVGHAMAKIGNVLYDPRTGDHHEPRGELLKSFHKRGFLARLSPSHDVQRIPWETIFKS